MNIPALIAIGFGARNLGMIGLGYWVRGLFWWRDKIRRYREHRKSRWPEVVLCCLWGLAVIAFVEWVE